MATMSEYHVRFGGFHNEPEMVPEKPDPANAPAFSSSTGIFASFDAETRDPLLSVHLAQLREGGNTFVSHSVQEYRQYTFAVMRCGWNARGVVHRRAAAEHDDQQSHEPTTFRADDCHDQLEELAQEGGSTWGTVLSNCGASMKEMAESTLSLLQRNNAVDADGERVDSVICSNSVSGQHMCLQFLFRVGYLAYDRHLQSEE